MSKYSFFCHKECEYFPCHDNIDPENFNCLFCYCPLYTLGYKCGGNFEYTNTNVKSCINCSIPHSPNGYKYIMSKFDEIKNLAAKNRNSK